MRCPTAVTKPAYAVFRLKVVVPGKCLGHTNIGEIEMSVKAVKDEPTKFGEARPGSSVS